MTKNELFQFLHTPPLTGKGVKIGVIDNFGTTHGHNVVKVIRTIAPDAEIVEYNKNEIGTTESFIRASKDNLDILNMSFSTGYTKEKANALDNLAGVLMFTSAGNTGKDSDLFPGSHKNVIKVAAYMHKINKIDGESSYGDIAAPSDIKVEYSPGYWLPFTGTSGASPVISACAALLIEYGLTPSKVREFLFSHCEDVTGDKDGAGVFRFPEGGLALNSPKYIILHHSATDGGTFESIRKYHMETNGWKDIGYHYLIETDGSVHKGRDERKEGAHTVGFNLISIGICLVGDFDKYKPNKAQLKALNDLISGIQYRYKIPNANIKMHRDSANKTCPGLKFPIEEVRDMHWAENIWHELNELGVTVHEKRFNDNITRGEVFALLLRIVKLWKGGE